MKYLVILKIYITKTKFIRLFFVVQYPQLIKSYDVPKFPLLQPYFIVN